ncbi:quercetin 2,3-dioxygenase [Chromohalobacter israelensis]|uniref:quercetin 2,3-dioxygenase n=1 Tax=Chromohalobacter israelensis TaxID=141390 RepID=UPI003AF8357D
MSGDAARLLADGTLPGHQALYALRDGEGQHYLIGSQVATVLARGVDTENLFEAVILTGGLGATLPARRHAKSDVALFALDGKLELWLDGQAHLLTRGDYAFIPAGTVYAHRMADWRTRFLSWSMGNGVGAMYPALGKPFGRPVQPECATNAVAPEHLRAAEAVADVEFVDISCDFREARTVTASEIPAEKKPYVLANGTGERLVAAEQMFSFLQTGQSSGGDFITVVNEGPAGEAIPAHYHREHSELFFCLDGHMTMWVNGQEVKLLPGDYLQVPAYHVHAYRLDAPYTRFLGWLTPGIFEPFFRLIGDPWEAHIFPEEPPAFRFDRVLEHIDEIDLYPIFSEQ